MTRISSLFAASALAILPISAFAQQTTAPAKPAEPSGMTATAPNTTAPNTTAPVTGKAASMAKPDVKTSTKTQVHGMNTKTSPHDTKTNAPANTAEPTKS